ncbi:MULTISPECIES: hypothetical protein [unclassified Streptomyces]|uniref:hypothetical protein n=1 Tax=unclassified Streptomyces TaxID=2593676 RepID=UPI002E31F978|nr:MULTISPECIES: hypothetical protein [unclassified Streptomyces]
MLSTRLTNARFVTMDPSRPVAHGLGIWHGRIVGLDEEVTALPARRVVDLRGYAGNGVELFSAGWTYGEFVDGNGAFHTGAVPIC